MSAVLREKKLPKARNVKASETSEEQETHRL